MDKMLQTAPSWIQKMKEDTMRTSIKIKPPMLPTPDTLTECHSVVSRFPPATPTKIRNHRTLTSSPSKTSLTNLKALLLSTRWQKMKILQSPKGEGKESVETWIKKDLAKL